MEVKLKKTWNIRLKPLVCVAANGDVFPESESVESDT